MNTSTDTLQLAKYLRSQDFSEKQAEAVAEVTRRLEEGQLKKVATKEDLQYAITNLKNQILIYLISVVGLLLAGMAILFQLFLG